jgi:hypothetical protein
MESTLALAGGVGGTETIDRFIFFDREHRTLSIRDDATGELVRPPTVIVNQGEIGYRDAGYTFVIDRRTLKFRSSEENSAQKMDGGGLCVVTDAPQTKF